MPLMSIIRFLTATNITLDIFFPITAILPNLYTELHPRITVIMLSWTNPFQDSFQL